MPTIRETASPRFPNSLQRAAARMDDSELEATLARIRRCALCMTRSRRQLAVMQIRCLECELERRCGYLPHDA